MRAFACLVVVACTRAPDRPDPPPTPIPAACVLAGEYRLRVGAGPVIWYRFTLAADGAISGASPARLAGAKVELDATSCIAVLRYGDADNPLVMTLRVQGAVVRGDDRSRYRTDDVSGVRDDGTPRPPLPCFVPGLYALESDVPLVCDPPGWPFKNPVSGYLLRLQVVHDAIVIDRVEEEPPHEPLFGDIATTRDGCEIALDMTYGRRLTAKLVFDGDRLDGVIHHTDWGGVQYGGRWSCSLDNAPFRGRRIR
jgi:hypothetical protein